MRRKKCLSPAKKYKPVRRIAQAGRSRGIHLIICTQRPEAKLVDSTTKAQLNARVALRVNDSMSSRMILGDSESDAQYLQKHGDIYIQCLSPAKCPKC